MLIHPFYVLLYQWLSDRKKCWKSIIAWDTVKSLKCLSIITLKKSFLLRANCAAPTVLWYKTYRSKTLYKDKMVSFKISVYGMVMLAGTMYYLKHFCDDFLWINVFFNCCGLWGPFVMHYDIAWLHMLWRLWKQFCWLIAN